MSNSINHRPRVNMHMPEALVRTSKLCPSVRTTEAIQECEVDGQHSPVNLPWLFCLSR
jgi:hypothetical protein